MKPDEAARKQAAIEVEVGITDDAIAAHISAGKTQAARTALSCLRLAIARRENGAMGLLKAAVEDCKKEIAR